LKKKHLAAIYLDFKPESFNGVEDYEIEWTSIYNKNKVKNLYQERKTNNGNISPPPQIIEKWYSVNQNISDKLKENNNISFPPQIIENSNLVEVNNKLNISSSSSSSSISSFGFSSDSIPFTSLKSSNLCCSLSSSVVDVDSNNEDAIDRLLKIKNNIPMHKHNNSVIYSLLSQMNLLRYGNRTPAQTLHSYFILRDSQLQFYLQQFRDIDVQNRNTYILEDGLYIGRKGLGNIVTNFKKKIIICFLTGKNITHKSLARRAAVFFPDNSHHFYIIDSLF
jgi:hypothetical protein